MRMGKGEKKFSTIAQHCAPTMTSGCDPGYTTARGHGVYMEWIGCIKCEQQARASFTWAPLAWVPEARSAY